MARDNNFLIGNGERLTHPVEIRQGGSPKNMPYDLPTARRRLSENVDVTNTYIRSLPQKTCPGDRTVALVTMHPRFVSKSDFPSDFMNNAGLSVLGSRQREVTPDSWGTIRHPDKGTTEQLLVAGRRTAFYELSKYLKYAALGESSRQSLLKIESITPFAAESKVKSIPDRPVVLLEVLLHNANGDDIVDDFFEYVTSLGANALTERRRTVEGLTFVPVEISRARVIDVARYSFVRVCRGMPTLRPMFPGVTRSSSTHPMVLPTEAASDNEHRGLVFDGGIPASERIGLAKWVSLVEPPGIGPAVPSCEEHGLEVTGAFLFGDIQPANSVPRPVCHVDHVRVIDQQTGTSGSVEYVDVIDRITRFLDANMGRYSFINLSIGPDLPVDDDDVSYWTLALDGRLASSPAVVTVAVGNSGDKDHGSGLDRVQPPSDAINALSVGASVTSAVSPYQRAPYSCIGPGRSPGLVKPDGVAFGGSPSEPFNVLHSTSATLPAWGTSFAAPLVLRSSAMISAQLGNALNPLTVRALMIHEAEDYGFDRKEVGWGLFELDPERLITCDDNSPTIIYQGSLPVGTPLRARVPLPKDLTGMITITATLLVAPLIDACFVGGYTEGGFLAVFRPHNDKYTYYRGARSQWPRTASFFCETGMYGESEFELREGGLKWEPCAKASRRFRSTSLREPCFDIYYHARESDKATKFARPLPYALIVTLHADKVPDLYDRVVRYRANVLVPVRPRQRIRIPVSRN